MRIRILLFRVLCWGPRIFRTLPSAWRLQRLSERPRNSQLRSEDAALEIGEHLLHLRKPGDMGTSLHEGPFLDPKYSTASF